MNISRMFEWDMGHRVTNHKSLCRNAHGHRYKMIVTITGDLMQTENSPAQGMVIDFGELKASINTFVVERLDHSFMYWKKDSVISSFAAQNPDLKFNMVDYVPTVECIVSDLAKRIQDIFEQQFTGISLAEVILYETPNCYATWKASGV